MLYERGFLRYITYRDAEILRMIYFALRDENWNTAEHIITHEEKDISWETFRISYESVSRLGGSDVISWKCSIEGSPDGSVHFTIEGLVLKELSKNRCGLCILHPLKGVTGQPAEVTTTQAESYSATFPTIIAPQNPFKNISSLKWKFHDLMFALTFQGDVFETEDQRNWTDASFKTFCTPSDLPIPVLMQPGEKIFQKVTFRPLQKLQPIHSHESIVIHLEKTGQITRLPRVGINCSATDISQDAIIAIKNIHFSHVGIEITPDEDDWVEKFSKRCEMAAHFNLPLSISLLLSENYAEEVASFVLLSKQNRLPLISVLLLSKNNPVTPAYITELSESLKAQLSGVAIGVGTNSDYKEINRNRVNISGVDFVSYAAHPQVHAKDDKTLIENIDGLRETGRACKIIYPDTQVHIGPLTIHPKKSREIDERQHEDFAALWTFGCLRAASEARVDLISLFDVTGIHGIMEKSGAPYPVSKMLQKILAYSGHDLVMLSNSEPLLVDAMLFTNESSTTLFLINYTDDLQIVQYGRNEFQVSPNAIQEINLSSA